MLFTMLVFIMAVALPALVFAFCAGKKPPPPAKGASPAASPSPAAASGGRSAAPATPAAAGGPMTPDEKTESVPNVKDDDANALKAKAIADGATKPKHATGYDTMADCDNDAFKTEKADPSAKDPKDASEKKEKSEKKDKSEKKEPSEKKDKSEKKTKSKKSEKATDEKTTESVAASVSKQ